jgi:hypothetical protein
MRLLPFRENAIGDVMAWDCNFCTEIKLHKIFDAAIWFWTLLRFHHSWRSQAFPAKNRAPYILFVELVAIAMITAIGTVSLLEAISIGNKKVRFYQTPASEMFGKVQEILQTEKTPFCSRVHITLIGWWLVIVKTIVFSVSCVIVFIMSRHFAD